MAMRRAAVAWAVAIVLSLGLLAMPLVALGATSAVTIQNFAFAPNSVTITAGDSVTWTNHDAASHSAKFPDRATAVLAQGMSATLQFTVAGTFPYICGIHGTAMQGTIVVRAAATVPPTPAPTAPPTPVRTAPPTVAPTAAPTETTTASPTTPPQSASPSPTSAPTVSPTESVSSSPVAVQLSPAPARGAGPGVLILAVAALAVLALGGIAFFLMRRS